MHVMSALSLSEDNGVDMAIIYIGIGNNINSKYYIQSAIKDLRQRFEK